MVHRLALSDDGPLRVVRGDDHLPRQSINGLETQRFKDEAPLEQSDFQLERGVGALRDVHDEDFIGHKNQMNHPGLVVFRVDLDASVRDDGSRPPKLLAASGESEGPEGSPFDQRDDAGAKRFLARGLVGVVHHRLLHQAPRGPPQAGRWRAGDLSRSPRRNPRRRHSGGGSLGGAVGSDGGVILDFHEFVNGDGTDDERIEAIWCCTFPKDEAAV
mmetsp:Transcript_26416/g.88833  ORF Transcript_26416/g.88833 Transcript_26416/m.88833 type:complete len:216 (+) Transcript_26416:1067-1714(+)